MIRSLVLLVLLSPTSFFLSQSSQSSRPFPDEDSFLSAARENLTRSNQAQYRYAYKERRTELHMNPFGRLGTGATLLYEVTPSGDGTAMVRRLLERDGKAVAESKPERQERRARPQGRAGVEDTVAALRFAIDRRETVAGREAIVVTFEPRPDAKPSTREGRIAKVMKGQIWLDEAAREVLRVEAIAIDNLSYGFGLLARLGEGTHVVLTRERVDDNVWLPTSIRFMGQGRALLVRKLSIDHVIEWFDYREVSNPRP